MNSKTIGILVAVVVIIIVVAGVGLYYYMGTGGGGGGGGGGGQTVYTVANATSLKYDANVTSQGVTIPYKFEGMNIGSSNLTIRVDLLGGASGNYTYVLIAGNQTAWQSVNLVCSDVSNDFLSLWTSWGGQWSDNYNQLKTKWSGSGDLTYTTTTGDTVLISNVVIQPTLPNSDFEILTK